MPDIDITALTKLASELTDRVDQLEQENAQLKANAETLSKRASEDKVADVVSERTVDATLSALLKVGCLNQDQLAESKQILLHDAEAPHRILQKILYAQSQVKTASDDQNIAGGKLADYNGKKDSTDDCMDRMLAILNV